jgi:outer membrane protein insertion porin family
MLAVQAVAQQTGLIRKIDVIGNKQVSTQAILNAMRTKVGQPYLKTNIELDKRSISEIGYFQSVDVREKLADNDNWDIVVEVLEYPTVKEIRLVGNTVFTTDELMKLITVETGKVFNLRDQTTSSKRIEDLYSKKGYFARIEEFKPLPESPSTINIVIHELTINSVSVQGNSRTKNSVFRHLIKSRSGQAYNRQKWETDLRRIYGTQWFENVRSIERQPDDPFRVDLIADVKETRTGIFNVGLQMDPRNSIAAVLKLQDSNFRGTGQAVGVDLLQGTRGGGASVGVDYSNPFIDNRDTALRMSLYSRVNYRFTGSAFGSNSVPTDDNTYTERRTGGSFGLSRPLSSVSSLGFNTRFESIKTNNLTTTNSTGFIKQDGNVGVFSLAYTRNRRDVDIDPSRGDWFRMQVEPGIADITDIGGSVQDPSVLGRHSFAKFNFEFRKYITDQPARTAQTLDAPRRVLAFRLFYGTITGKTPFFEQYFAGGSETVRGYEEDRFWGNHTLVSNVELRYPVQKAFSVIGFVDYGGAWGGYGSVNQFTQTSKMKLHLGYGIGFSFRTPLGPLRLDLGFDERGKSRTHFLIGTSF